MIDANYTHLQSLTLLPGATVGVVVSVIVVGELMP
jgi:hypothetical protein